MKISAIIDNLGPSQNAFYMIKEFNKMAADYTFSCSAFINRITSPVIKPLFSCPIVAYFSGYNGVAIATTIREAVSILNSSNNSKKYLYLWDLEWIYRPQQYEYVYNVIADPRLKLIARSKSHAQLIEGFCNKSPCGIVNNWNKNQLLRVVE